MFTKKILTAVITTLTIFIFTTSQVLAVNSGGYANQVPSARAMGRANALVASVDDASAVTFNAARLPEVPGSNLSAGFALQEINTKYKSFSGVSDKSDNDLAVTPNFHISSKFNQEKWGFGLGINVPHGISTNWTKSSPLRFIATKSELSAWNINPSVGYQINEALSIGAGFDYYWVNNVSMKRQVSVTNLNFALGGTVTGTEPEAEQVLKGDGSNVGYDIGLAYNINKRHLFGVSYRQGAAVKVKGDLTLTNLSAESAGLFGGSDYKTNGETKLIIPSQLMLGYAFKPTEKWVIELDGQWDKWSKYQDLNVKFSETDPNRLGVLNSSNPSPKNWKDVWSFGIGTEYLLNAKWALRGGYSYYNTPVPDSSFEASVPDANAHILSLGAGYNIFEDLSVDAAVQVFKTLDRSISNTVGASDGTTGDGEYKSTGSFYGFNLRYTFGKKS